MRRRGMTWLRRLAKLGVVLAAFVIGVISADTSDTPPFQVFVYDDRFIATGVIQPGAAATLKSRIVAHPGIRTLVLLSVPGAVDVDNTLEMGLAVREAALTTVVPADGLVASGGTDLFLAGTRRIIERGACIGVHSWRDGIGLLGSLLAVDGSEADRDHPLHARFLDYQRKLGIPDAFYWFTLRAATPDTVHWMSVAEVVRFGVATTVRRADGTLRADTSHDAGDCSNRL